MSVIRPDRVYLDNNATAPLRREARAAVLEVLDGTGNPSSVHREGRWARGIVDDARRAVSELVGCEARSVIFTSGATEANSTVINQSRWSKVAVSAVEHASVIEPAKRLGDGVNTILPVGRDGLIDLDALQAWLEMPCDGDRLVSVQWANGETGIVQPIHAIAEIVTEHGAFLHVDAVQAAGRSEINQRELGAGFLTVSSHKIGGPQGVGAIIQGVGGELRHPLLVGGGQESRLRAGTENVAGCAGFAAAARAARDEAGDQTRLKALRDRLEHGVREISPDAIVVGENGPRLANTSAVGLAGKRAETSVIAFDLAGVAVSAGSACSSGKVGQSHVLTAMGLDAAVVQSVMRFSLGWASREEDVTRFLEVWGRVMDKDRSGVAVAVA